MVEAEISQRTVGRALQNVIFGKHLEQGADYLENHEIKKFLLWVLSLGIYTSKAEEEIQGKKQLLLTSSTKLVKTIINAEPDPAGDYECSFQTISNTGTLVKATFHLSYNARTQALHIWNADNPSDVETIPDISFRALKKALLHYHLEKAREKLTENEERINLSSNLINLSDLDDFNGINFEKTCLDRENFAAVISKAGNLRGARFTEGTDLSGLSFRNIPIDRYLLAHLILNNVSVQGVELSEQDLSEMLLGGVDFTDANFTACICHHTSFNGANFTRANFADADFTSANFSVATLNQIANGNRAKLNRAIVREIKTDDVATIFPGPLPEGVIFSPDVVRALIEKGYKNFTGVTLDYTKLYSSSAAQFRDGNGDGNGDKSDLSGLTFDRAILERTLFKRADLTGTTFKNTILKHITINQHTQLNQTDFTEADFSDADLSKSVLQDSTIIKDANVTRAKLSRSFVEQAIKQQVNLKDADLSGADLRGLDLSQLNLDGANLKGAKLDETLLNLSVLTAALKTRAIMGIDEGSGQPTRQSVDLKKVILKGTQQQPLDLGELNLSNVDFTDATLEHCVLDGSNLTNANLSDVDLATVSLMGVTGAYSIIVRESDCHFYENQYQHRLRFIMDNPVISHDQADPVLTLSPESRLTLFNGIFFIPSAAGLANGYPYHFDGAQQNLYVEAGGLDQRTLTFTIDEEEEKQQAILNLNKKLLEDGFSDAQKTLFYQARNAICAMHGITRHLMDEKFKEITQLEQAYQNKLQTRSYAARRKILKNQYEEYQSYYASQMLKNDIYLANHTTAQRLRPELLEGLFDVIVEKFKEINSPNGLRENKLLISDQEIREVKNLFMDRRYIW